MHRLDPPKEQDPTTMSESADSASASPPAPPKPPCSCDEDPIEGLRQMFVDYAQGRTIVAGRDPATRPVFLRLHGVAHGRFEVRPDLPDELRVGVLSQRSSYPAWVRFSSDVQPGVPDLKGTCGIGIKLFGVEGEKMLPPEPDATTQDFILQNMNVFFTDTAKDMCEFTCASLNGKREEYLERHPTTRRILEEMEKVVDSVLETPYWSGLPFHFGEGRYVKYKIEPEVVPPASGGPDYEDPFYLRADLHERLARGEARLKFLVQLRTDDACMPLDAATVPWSEEESPPIHVATLVLPRQDLGTRNQSNYGENLAFNIWRALAEHEPVGSLADARKVVYRASATSRRNVNGLPLGEPAEPRPAEWRPGEPYPEGRDEHIVRAAIFPGVGVSRLGNSDEYFLGPEVFPSPTREEGFYRDASGALKRQAARFRVYGYNCRGEVVRELTSGFADVRWKVHVANRKAAWYQWVLALDIPEAKDTKCPLRNPKVRNRDELVIDAGEVTIRGADQTGEEYRCDGTFQKEAVGLGRLETDGDGRLVFVPAAGVSGSPHGTPIYDPENNENAFINADGWYDDACDGPVTAEVTIEGRSIPCEGAWVLSAPPDYAPDVVSVRTLYDLLRDLYVQVGWLDFPSPISFQNDVYPILRRLSGLGWVNKGFEIQFGLAGPYPFEDPDFVARLADRGDEPKRGPQAELRRQILNSFRVPTDPTPDQLPWPWVYGDAMEVPAGDSPNQNATISETQYRILQSWAAGDFVDDWDADRQEPAELGDVPLAEQPETLTRSALEYCLADAFHPGCEVTWPIRHLTMWRAPFRLEERPPGTEEPNYGSVLTPEIALSPDGPLHAQGPGDMTRWMGLPWQADTGFCRSGYDRDYDPYVPTFWPATVPNQVLTPEIYEKIMAARTPEERFQAFLERFGWVLPLAPVPPISDPNKSAAYQMRRMVEIFGSMGNLEVRPGPADDPVVPSQLMVATFGPGVRARDLTPAERQAHAVSEAQARDFESGAAEAFANGSAGPDSAASVAEPGGDDTGWASAEDASRAPRPVKTARSR